MFGGYTGIPWSSSKILICFSTESLHSNLLNGAALTFFFLGGGGGVGGGEQEKARKELKCFERF